MLSVEQLELSVATLPRLLPQLLLPHGPCWQGCYSRKSTMCGDQQGSLEVMARWRGLPTHLQPLADAGDGLQVHGQVHNWASLADLARRQIAGRIRHHHPKPEVVARWR